MVKSLYLIRIIRGRKGLTESHQFAVLRRHGNGRQTIHNLIQHLNFENLIDLLQPLKHIWLHGWYVDKLEIEQGENVTQGVDYGGVVESTTLKIEKDRKSISSEKFNNKTIKAI